MIHATRQGTFLSKLTSFLFFQRHQAPIIKITMKNADRRHAWPGRASGEKFLPDNSQCKPSANCRGTIEEKVFSSFLNIIMALNTIVAFLKHFPSSPQHITRVQSVIECQPSNELDFWDTFGFPSPNNTSTRPELSELVLIVVSGYESMLPQMNCQESLEYRSMGGRLLRKC